MFYEKSLTILRYICCAGVNSFIYNSNIVKDLIQRKATRQQLQSMPSLFCFLKRNKGTKSHSLQKWKQVKHGKNKILLQLLQRKGFFKQYKQCFMIVVVIL